MEDFKKLDSLTLTKLTMAILKAASVAIASLEDRSLILANQLKKDDVPKHLTKLATKAFNRRLSVSTLRQRSDEDKADTFALADFNKVAELRGCKLLLKKASVRTTPFKFLIVRKRPERILKRASLESSSEVSHLTPLKALNKIAIALLKTTNLIEDLLHAVRQDMYVLLDLKKRASKAISEDIKTGKLLATVYGASYTNLFKDSIPEEALIKNASYALLPKNFTVLITLKTIKQADIVNLKSQLLLIKKNAAMNLVVDSEKLLNVLKKKILNKDAALGEAIRDAAINAVTIPGLTAASLAEGAASTASDYAKDITKLLSHRYSINPESALTAKLINTLRYDDRADRIVDMMADADFKNYRVEDILKAVSSSISLHPLFLSPRFKLYLKTSVSNKLLAGNRTNTATQAALAEMLKRLSEADKNRNTSSSLLKIKNMKPVLGKDISFGDIIIGADKLKTPTKTISQLIIPVMNLEESYKKFKDEIKTYQDTKLKSDQANAEHRFKIAQLISAMRDAVYKDVLINTAKNDPSVTHLTRAEKASINSIADINKLTDNKKRLIYDAALRYILRNALNNPMNLIERAYHIGAMKPVRDSK